MILLVISIIISVSVFAVPFVLFGSNAGLYSWSGTMLSRNDRADSWIISANTVNGNGRRNINFTYDNLNNLHVENKNGDGTVLIKLTQGNNEKTIDVTGEFNEYIDMRDFEPGRINMRIVFEKVRDLRIEIKW